MSIYYNNWMEITNESMSDYSKIHDANCVTGDINHNEKLLFLEFYKNIHRNIQYISNKMYIIQTVSVGDIICGKSLYLECMCDTLGRRIYRTSSNSSLLYPCCVLFHYHNPSKQDCCAKYCVRLYEDKLLEDIRTKQKPIPTLLQLCVSAISTKELERYNEMNKTMLLAMK